MAKKYKITRKQIKQDDKFVAALKDVTKKIVLKTTGREVSAIDWPRFLILSAVGLAILCLLAGGVYSIIVYRNHKAERLMAQADTIYRAPVVSRDEYEKEPMYRAVGAYTDAKKKWSDAAERYEAVAAAYPSTDYGILSLLYLGNCYYDLGEYPEAIARYQGYIKKAGANAPFASLTRQSIGYAQEAMNKLDDAEKTFLALSAEEGSTISVLSLFDLARIYETKKNYPKAIEALKKITATELATSPEFFQLRKKAEEKIKALEPLVGGGSAS